MKEKTIKLKEQEPGRPEVPAAQQEIEITETDTVTKTTVTTLRAINEEDEMIGKQIEALQQKQKELREQKEEIKKALNINDEEK